MYKQCVEIVCSDVRAYEVKTHPSRPKTKLSNTLNAAQSLCPCQAGACGRGRWADDPGPAVPKPYKDRIWRNSIAVCVFSERIRDRLSTTRSPTVEDALRLPGCRVSVPFG